MNRRRFTGEGRTDYERRSFEGRDDFEDERDRYDERREFAGDRGWDRDESRRRFESDERRFDWRGHDRDWDRNWDREPRRAGWYRPGGERDFDEMGAGFARYPERRGRDLERRDDWSDWDQPFRARERERGWTDDEPTSRGWHYGGRERQYGSSGDDRFAGNRGYERGFERERDYGRRWRDVDQQGWDDYGREQYWSGQGGSEFAGVTGRRYTEPWQDRWRGQPPGRFTGRGPRGYRFSDDRIREEVSELLYNHGEVDASDVDVRVENGEVTLEGWVDSRHTKRLAEDVAEQARGVQEVHNRLRVRRGMGDTGDWSARGAGFDFDTTGAPGSPVDARQYGSTGTGAGLNMTTNTGSGMDTGTTMRTSPGMHSHSGTGTSGSVASGMGATGHTGVGSVVRGPGTSMGTGERTADAGTGGTFYGTRAGGQFTAGQRVPQDAEVFDIDGASVGSVKEVRERDFLLDRPLARDVYVPFSAVRPGETGRVELTIRSDEIDQQNWELAPLLGQDQGAEGHDRTV